ncbi:intermembrane lipid transfer protein VPS13A-like isoform X2 [Ostrea edulis]|uniref:intermembrane lipid transfer protein VPS13A-like isoform X2 n=1 Tax=Ostrea edulis TaxID=37623 RepID=UPI0024AFE2B0|nr:intermembrane lipid transfer protein VPS13A-like isoform X2 [Ostrea edulis]
MVFESLVADLINKYLGDFVENLDRSQLKIGIWGGDVVLQNLDLKESALDDLDLPVKIKAGHIGKLTLKIPWKNLYKEAVIASIDGLYALAVPNAAIKYNAEKEEKAKQESKQKKLQQMEEAKKAAAEKGKETEQKRDSFAEKMAAQIIKNLQVQVQNIHIRYEDAYTNPAHPFAIGVSLAELLFQTTDENWKPCVLKEVVNQVFKLVKLDSLAVYWDSSAELYSSLENVRLLEKLGKEIAGKDHSTTHQFLIKPISSVAHLKLNMKPELNNFSLPKAFLTVVFDEIAVGLSKLQYNDVLEMLESFERMYLMSVYRKYRPDVPLHKNAKTWWHFARDSVLEETVRRRRRMFSWSHIIEHRVTMKKYRDAYVKKLSNPKKVPKDVQKEIEDYEKILDVFCITLMRSQAEVEAAKLGAKKAEEKSGGWFGGLFGGKKKKQEGKEEKDIKEQFEDEFSEKEKAKLYEAIGYQENETDPTLPKEFVAVRLVTKLSSLSLTLNDETKKEPQIVKLQLRDVYANVGQRPADSAVQVDGKIDKFTVVGSPQGGTLPRMVVSQNEEQKVVYSLLNFLLETNPLDRKCDTRVVLEARPLQIVYDAISVNNLADFFKPPKEVYLKQLSRAAMAKFEDIKEQSATGLKHAIEQHKYTDIRVDLKPSYVIIPHGGYYKKGAVNMLVLDLGNLKVNSEKNTAGDNKAIAVEDMMSRAYDNFKIKLDRVQLLYAKPGEDWNSARSVGNSLQHVLHPISINLLVQKSMFDNDRRLAKLKISGDLPLLSLSLSDRRLQEILQLAQSIPLPEGEDLQEEENIEIFSDSLDIPLDINENQLMKKVVVVSTELAEQENLQSPRPQDVVNRTIMEMKFEIKEVSISLQEHTDSGEIPMIKLVLHALGTKATTRKFDMEAEAYLGGIYLQHLKFKATDSLNHQLQSLTSSAMEGGPLINLINTPSDDETRLLTFNFHKADPEGPEFATTFENTEQTIDVRFTSLEVLLHQEALLSVMKFAAQLQQSLQVRESPPKEMKPEETKKQSQKEDPLAEPSTNKRTSSKSRKKETEDTENRINLRVTAELEGFGVAMCTNDNVITNIQINGISAGVILQNSKTSVTSELREVTVYDVNSKTNYPKIMEIRGDSVLKLSLIIYNNATEGEKYSDMSSVDTRVDVQLGCIRAVFLMRFITDLLEYMNGYQVEELETQIEAAREKVREASEAVAESAKGAVARLAEKSPRVAIKVTMSAPVILVPQKSDSQSVLLVDFGHLEVGNIFSPVKTTEEIPAVLDSMRICLKSLKIARAELDDSGDVIGQCLILEPVNVNLSVTRNLAFAWYKEIPAVDISGQLERISATMSQGDYKVIMTLLNDNFSEGQKSDSVTSPVKPKDTEAAALTQDGGTQQPDSLNGSPSITVTPPEQSDTFKLYTQLRFNFQITTLSATLYIGESSLTKEGENSRSAENALGQFMLEVIGVEGQMKSDGSMTTKVILKDTVLDDKRKQKQEGGVKSSHAAAIRMVERLSGEGKQDNMIDVNFTQDPSQDKDIQVKISSIRVVVCLDFLMTLGEFFTSGLPEAKPEAKAASQTPTQNRAATPTKAPPPTSDMSIIVSMEKPEIILIEDQMDPTSNALLLGMEVMFRMRVTPETQDMSASVNNLQIASAVFNERDKRKSQILNPCDISYYSKVPHGRSPHMDISTTDLILNISPRTIRTITLITANLSKQEEAKEDETKARLALDLWSVKKVSDRQFWFLKEEEGAETIMMDSLSPALGLEEEVERGELLIMKIPNVVVKLEGGVGKRTVPLLIAESSFDAQVKNWSSKLEVECNAKLEVAFYNEKLSVWESLVEPVMDNGKMKKWDLGLQVLKNDDLPPEEEDEEEDSKNIVLPPPKMSINIQSHDPLEITVTKTCLEVLNNLTKAFGDAYKLVTPAEEAGTVLSPYVINNHTGIPVVLKLDNAFEMPTEVKNGKMVLESEQSLPLYGRKRAVLKRQASVIKSTQDGDEKKFIFQIEKFGATREVTIKRTEKRLYPVNHKTYPGDTWAIVCSTEAMIGQKSIHLRSIVQMKNNLPNAVEIFFRSEKSLMSCGVVRPGDVFNVPLPAVYTPDGQFLLKPQTENCEISKVPICWRTVESSPKIYVPCPYKDGSDYVICVRSEVIPVYYDETEELSAKTYLFHLSPSIVFHNLLNIPITFLLEGMGSEVSLSSGENTALLHAMPGKSHLEVGIPQYQDLEWHGRQLLSGSLPQLSMWMFTAVFKGPQKISLNLGLHCTDNEGCLDISLYSPYWLINKTGKTLYFKGSDSDEVVEHPAEKQEVTFFSFKPKTSIVGKKKASKPEKEDRNKKVKEWRQVGKVSLRIGDTDWSDKFSLDTVGSSGTIQSKTKSRLYEVGVKIRLSSSGLTKICTFTPMYMLLNTSHVSLLCTEARKEEEWIQVPPKSCLPFWPVYSGKEMTMKAKVKDSLYCTTPFYFNKPHTTLLRVDDEMGGINVDCQVTEAATVTTLTTYKSGMATVLMINSTDCTTVKFNQSGEKSAHVLEPNETVLYTWENAVGKRELEWSSGEIKSQKTDLIQDGTGSFFFDSDTKIYWVSFLDGLQRILLFTEDLAVAINAQEAGELERIEQEINVSLKSVGVSLVNDVVQTEVAYLGITSSGIIWEEKKKRYKALNLKTTTLLETAYQKYVTDLELGHRPPEKLMLDNKMEVNFQEMRMLKPNQRGIRRSFQDGVWIQYKTSPHQLQVHAKINRLQLDNQTNGYVFPTVLAPIPPPKSVASDSVPKPFAEVSIMSRKHEHSNMLQFKYFKVLVQEMSLKVDQGFLNNVIDLFTSNQQVSRDQEREMLEEDVKGVYTVLLEEAGLSLAEEQKNFYDYLHFSPIKIHLSFSLQGGKGGDGKAVHLHADIINVFLQSVGVVLTDVQDVVFKLGFFQREHRFYNQSQLNGEMGRHYAGQAVKQLYVLVLGLDVLGNPFGLLRGMAEGVEDLFYEPYQGAIQGPEEFAEGLALGVRSLLGHAVGGAAGAVSRITGTIGKGLAALTFDDEYQKKRREGLNKKPANIGEGFARGGKGLVMGVFDGVTGIVRKPIEGAQKEGVEGFFKGIGKGLVGVVTRPTSGVIDFASSSFEGIKRIAEMSDDVGRLRPPRRFHADKVVRPYNIVEASGYAILQETEKGKYAETDEYVAHSVIIGDGKSTKSVLIVTDRRVIYANRGDIFGHWDAEWTHTWSELKEKPKRSAKGVEFLLKDEKKKKFPFQLGSSAKKIEVHISDPKRAEWLVGKIAEAMEMK